MIHPSAIIDKSAKVPASCDVGAYAIIGAEVELGEHCEIGSHATLHGPTKIGSHNRIFSFAAIGCEPQDLLPFTKTVARREVATFGLNALGLERRGFSKERIAKLQRAYKTIRRNNSTQALELLRAEKDSGEDVAQLIKFIESSERGIIR